MTARDRLEFIFVKLDRAKEHLASLSADVRAYLDSQPYAVGVKCAPDTRRMIYFVAEVRTIPLRIPAVLGDAIHNLRSALDHLAYQLVWLGSGKKPSSHVYFPIEDDRTKYNAQRSQKIKGATAAAIATVDGFMPYKGGNDVLWRLHKLNNIDKHRVLLTAGSAFQSVNLGSHLIRQLQKAIASSPMPEKFSKLPDVDFYVQPGDRMFPLKVGDELFIDEPDASFNERLEFRFDVAFGEQDIAFGEPIVETLSSMVQLVGNILSNFEPHLQ